MNSNIIIDALPYSVTIDGDEVEINADFRSMMITEMLLLTAGLMLISIHRLTMRILTT